MNLLDPLHPSSPCLFLSFCFTVNYTSLLTFLLTLSSPLSVPTPPPIPTWDRPEIGDPLLLFGS